MSQLAGEGTLLAIRVSQVAKSAIEETLVSESDREEQLVRPLCLDRLIGKYLLTPY